MTQRKSCIIIDGGRNPWPHEMRVAKIFADAGYFVEFLPESHIHTADILLNGVDFEIKSPENARAITLERAIKKALKQSRNIIIDSSRMKGHRDDILRKYLIQQAQIRKQIKRMYLVTKHGRIIDIK